MKQRDMRRARSDGRRDGERAIPRPEVETQPPAVQGKIQGAGRALAELTTAWLAADAAALAERETLGRRIEQRRSGVPGRRKELREVRARTAKALAGLHPRRQELEERSSGLHVRGWIYAVALAVVFAAEFPLNAIAFQLFGESQLMTWLMTAGLAVMLVVCAHFAGAALRGGRTAKDRWIAVVTIAVPVATLVTVALLREAYLARAAGGLLGTALGIAGFLTINLLIFVGAFVLSYLAHDPVAPELRRIDRQRAEHERALAEAERALVTDVEALARDEQRFAAIRVEREKGFEATRERAVALARLHEQLVSAYWEANLRARRDGETPLASQRPPRIEIPRRLEKQLDPPRQLVAETVDISEEAARA